MTSEATLIVQLARDGSVDRHLRADPPPSVVSGRVVLDHVAGGPGGRLGPPAAGEIVLSVLSPEAFTRDPQEVRDAVGSAEESEEPPVILVEAAEELREDELDAVLDAAGRAHRVVIVRVMADA
jgi:hypothetical protein